MDRLIENIEKERGKRIGGKEREGEQGRGIENEVKIGG